jgi:hypothetical protein
MGVYNTPLQMDVDHGVYNTAQHGIKLLISLPDH